MGGIYGGSEEVEERYKEDKMATDGIQVWEDVGLTEGHPHGNYPVLGEGGWFAQWILLTT